MFVAAPSFPEIRRFEKIGAVGWAFFGLRRPAPGPGTVKKRLGTKSQSQGRCRNFQGPRLEKNQDIGSLGPRRGRARLALYSWRSGGGSDADSDSRVTSCSSISFCSSCVLRALELLPKGSSSSVAMPCNTESVKEIMSE